MIREQAINNLVSTGMTEEQITEVVEAIKTEDYRELGERIYKQFHAGLSNRLLKDDEE